MSAAELELINLRAENKRLREVTKVKNQLLTSKNQVIACKDAIIEQIEEESQQYTSPQPAKLGSGRQRQNSSIFSTETTSKSPLDKDEMLDQIFLHVGGGEHLYIAAVSRRWRGRYLQHCVQNSTTKYTKKLVTRHRSVIVTESRLQLALNCGLTVKDWPMHKLTYPDAICQHSIEPQQVITLLRIQGVPWDAMLCNNAALHAKLPLLQWLRSSACPWVELNVLCNAGRGGSVAMLEWLLTVTSKWKASTKLLMIDYAGWNDRLDAVQWLKAQGAQWPAKFAGQYITMVTNVTHNQCWSLSAVQWAIVSGSGWLDWHCEDYAAGNFTLLVAKQNAAAVLEWAHADGCPCTCGQQ
jgi:hypothetical protein